MSCYLVVTIQVHVSSNNLTIKFFIILFCCFRLRRSNFNIVHYVNTILFLSINSSSLRHFFRLISLEVFFWFPTRLNYSTSNVEFD